MCYPFHNKSDKDIYFVFDFHPRDNVITVKSRCVFVESGSWEYYRSKGKHFKEMEEDSIHVYILDRAMVDLGGVNREYCLLTEEQLALIDENAILERVTRTPKSNPFEYSYDSK